MAISRKVGLVIKDSKDRGRKEWIGKQIKSAQGKRYQGGLKSEKKETLHRNFQKYSVWFAKWLQE